MNFAELQEAVTRLFFGSTDDKRFHLTTKLRVLLVDDEPYVGDAVSMMLAFDGVYTDVVESGLEALRMFNQGNYDLVMTDYAMPSMKGDELARSIKEISPSRPVVLITAYAEMLKVSENPLVGVDFIIAKPFLLESLREAIDILIPQTSRTAVESWYPTLQAEGTILILNNAVWSFRKLLKKTKDSERTPELMIRHKAKNLVLDYIRCLPSIADRKIATSKLSLQLLSLHRFYERISISKGKDLAIYLDQVIRDLRREHSGISVDSDLGQELEHVKLPLDSIALVSLIVCELIDNAVEAVKGKGEVRVEVNVLPSKNSLHIKVCDNGPGVEGGGESRIFKEHYSTHGQGRGLGLHLVKEGILKLGGTINYSFDEGAVFKALIPLSEGALQIANTNRSISSAPLPSDSQKNSGEVSQAVKLAFSYSHKDEELRDELESHLKLLQRQGFIRTWHDRKIMPGDKWANVIDDNFKQADLILLLVSADFLASDYCNEVEMQIALERDKAGEARVVPVIVRACDWHNAPFGKLQGLPKDAKPVTSWTNRDEAWNDVAKGLRRVVEEIRTRKA